MEAGSSSMLYIADTLNRKILKVGLDGTLLNQIDMTEISNNKRILVKCVNVRKQDGDVFTADFEKCIVYHLDQDLVYKNNINCSHNDEIRVIRSVYALPDYLVLCVRGKNQVVISNYEGEIIGQVNCKKVSGFDWSNPVKICGDNELGFIVSDKENDRVLRFDNQYNLVCSSDDNHAV